MDALIFDFDGVIVDSEHIHLACFRQVLADVGLSLTDDEYYDSYLGYDDHDCFQAVGSDKDCPFTEEQIDQMTRRKTQLVQDMLTLQVQALPGAVELVRSAARAAVPLAICSGALRAEVELAAGALGILPAFAKVVAAEDVEKGKPDPEGYVKAAARLSAALGRNMAPARCVVVEDSPAGIAAAKGAGMRVLGVTNSYAADALAEADKVVSTLEGVSLASLDELLIQA